MKQLSLFILLSFFTFTGTFAQTLELDSLRVLTKAGLKSGNPNCELCYQYADQGMFDSAQACIDIHSKLDLNAEAEIYTLLAEAKIWAYTYHSDEADSLYQLAYTHASISNIPNKLKKLLLSNMIAFYERYQLCDAGMVMAQKLIRFAKKTDDNSALVEGYIEAAILTRCLFTSIQAQPYIDSAEMVAEHSLSLKNRYHEWLGYYFYYFDQLTDGVQHFLIASRGYKNLNHSKREYLCYSYLADIYQYLEDHRKAIVYLKMARKFAEESQNNDLAYVCNSTCWSFLKLNEFDSAKHYAQQAMHLYRTLCPSNPEIAYPIGNLGLIHRQIGNPDSALAYSTQALEIFAAYNDYGGMAESYNNLGFISIVSGDTKKAIDYHNLALKNLTASSEDYEETMNSHYGLYRCYKATDPGLALHHHELFMRYYSMRKFQEEAILAERAEADIKLSENAQRIRELEVENTQKSLEIQEQNRRIIFTTMGLVVFIIIATLIFIYWFQRKRIMLKLQDINSINERVISMISHDFRGPMNNIRLMLELLRDEELSTEEFQKLSADLYKQSTEVSLLYDSFVVWAVSQSSSYEPVKTTFLWSEIVEETIELTSPIAQMKGVEIKLNRAEDHKVATDRMASAVILRNILSNAVKYSNENSIVEISFYSESEDMITVIKDYGIGMEQELVDRLFAPRHHASRKGTNREYGAGLGLRLVIQFINYLQGTISVDSEKGIGSSFIMRTPIQLDET